MCGFDTHARCRQIVLSPSRIEHMVAAVRVSRLCSTGIPQVARCVRFLLRGLDQEAVKEVKEHAENLVQKEIVRVLGLALLKTLQLTDRNQRTVVSHREELEKVCALTLGGPSCLEKSRPLVGCPGDAMALIEVPGHQLHNVAGDFQKLSPIGSL